MALAPINNGDLAAETRYKMNQIIDAFGAVDADVLADMVAAQAATEAAAALLPVESISNESGYAWQYFDADDFNAGGWLRDGTFAPEAFRAPVGSIVAASLNADLLSRLLASGFTGEWFTFPTESGYGFIIEDAEGYIALGIENSGDIYGNLNGSIVEPVAPTLPSVAVYGDSMSDDGATVPWLNPGEDWPSVLSGLGRTVKNRAVAGQTAGQIMAHQMGSPCLITVTGDVIPTSGSVAITAKSELFVQSFGSQEDQSVSGFLCGVYGTILRDAPGNTHSYTFERTTAGIAIPCPAASPFVTDVGVSDQADTQVLWVGRNGLSTLTTTTVTKVEDAIRYIGHGRFLIVGVCNVFDGSEDIGSTDHGIIVTYNNYMAARWGGRFFDVRRYMIDEALADAGITPTSEDLAAIAADRIPIRFKEVGDGIIHFNALANSLVGAKINSILNAKGF